MTEDLVHSSSIGLGSIQNANENVTSRGSEGSTNVR
jgi:hypothetical protein